jgi:SNW domain-containing protein 1
MGKNAGMAQKVVSLQVDENGKVAWDAVLKQGAAKDKWAIYTRPEDSREKWSKPEDLEKPTLELDVLNTERTQKALELALNGKMQAGAPKRAEDKAPEFVRYTPNPSAPGYTPNCAERVIKVVERPVDPFMPPRFKHKKVPRGPPSPPAPVHHSPAKKLTAQDQKDWKIPPCVSNWKNVKGYTIPLDKRLAADGRNLQDVAVNDKFAALSEDLYLAERKAREEIKIRNDMIKQKRVREEEIRETQLRDLAAQARQQRAELAANASQEGESAQDSENRKQRMDVLNERRREIERDQRLELAGKKDKRGRAEDRDISERIALGQVAQPTSQEAQYDARLFNQSAGLDSGYHGGADDHAGIYDKPLFADRSQVSIYKFDKERMDQNEGRLEHIGTKGNAFGGAADGEEATSASQRNAPVEFEREDSEPRDRGRGDRDRGRERSRSRRRGRDDDDDFGLDGLLEETKRRR